MSEKVTYKNETLQSAVTVYGWILSMGTNLQSLFLLWMRLTWGHQLVLAGINKLLNMDQTIQFFNSIHIIYPTFHAFLVAYIEIIGGLCIILGFASRLVAVPLSIIMIAALSTAHAGPIANFKFISDPSTLVNQAPYPFLITALLMLVFGPGRVSVDAWIERWVHKQPTY
jgi:putative oxidoreductase